jgi:hypothetical protein
MKVINFDEKYLSGIIRRLLRNAYVLLCHQSYKVQCQQAIVLLRNRSQRVWDLALLADLAA